MKTLDTESGQRVAGDYLDLVRAFPLRRIKSEREHSEAVKILGRLMGRPDGRVTAGVRDYVDVLGGLIDDYGQASYPALRIKHSPLEVLKYLMEEGGLSSDDLGKILGNKTAASLVLNGKRELSKSHIRRLSEYFKVDAGLFF